LAAFSAPDEGERRKGELHYKVLKLREKSKSPDRLPRAPEPPATALCALFQPLSLIGGSIRVRKLARKLRFQLYRQSISGYYIDHRGSK